MRSEEISDIAGILKEIKALTAPKEMILFHRKLGARGQTVGFKVCLVLDVKNKLEIEKKIYRNIDSEIPFDICLYTSEEWQKLKVRENSFASKILKGKSLTGNGEK